MERDEITRDQMWDWLEHRMENVNKGFERLRDLHGDDVIEWLEEKDCAHCQLMTKGCDDYHAQKDMESERDASK